MRMHKAFEERMIMQLIIQVNEYWLYVSLIPLLKFYSFIF